MRQYVWPENWWTYALPTITAPPLRRIYTKEELWKLAYAARLKKNTHYIICEVCGSSKKTIDAKTKFCSIRCKNKSIEERNSEPRTCLQCHDIFYERMDKPQRFCSRKCSAQNRSDWICLQYMSDHPEVGKVSLI